MSMTSGIGGVANRAAIIFGGVWIMAGNAHSEEVKLAADKYELQVFEDALGGREILAGDLAAAVSVLEGDASLDSTYAKKTNMCVALTLAEHFDAALSACETARRYSMRSLDSYLFLSLGVRRKEALQIAANNLGVLYALQGKAEAALESFEAAGNLGGSVSAATERNVSALAQRHDPKEMAGL
jgi:tetratricopeptide (TPR) repeat protein